MTNGGRKLRGVRATRAIRAFLKSGYRVGRIHGSHYILEHDERPPIQIPRHGTLKQGLLLSMVKRAGLFGGGIRGILMMEYTIIIHPAEEGGFWTEVPALPGCGSQGETIDEAIQMTRDAIEGFLAYLREKGQEIPEDRDILVKVSVAA